VSVSLEHLKAVASDFLATVSSETPDSLVVRFEIVRADGVREIFHLNIVDNGSFPKVSEREPHRLPSRCRDRHIRGDDGWFCLSWNPGEPSEVVDAETARAFWSRLDKFLQAQLTASTLRRWPAQSNARAHGDAAAFQDLAEEIAAQFGPNVLRDVRLRRFKVARAIKPGKVRLELLRDGRRVARVPLRGGLITAKTRCFCDEAAITAAEIGVCRNHAELAPALIRAIDRWHTEHDAFVRKLVASGYRCCGTLGMCEMRSAGAPLSTKPEITGATA
jgi:hypothetical protein